MDAGNGRSDSRVGEGGRLSRGMMDVMTKRGGGDSRGVKCSRAMTDVMPTWRRLPLTMRFYLQVLVVLMGPGNLTQEIRDFKFVLRRKQKK